MNLLCIWVKSRSLKDSLLMILPCFAVPSTPQALFESGTRLIPTLEL